MTARQSSAEIRRACKRDVIAWLHGLYLGRYRTWYKPVVIVERYKAFLDASGTDRGQPVVAYAGFVSTPLKWVKFTGAWVDVLTRHGVDVFHMAPFFSAKGDFATWSNDARAALVGELAPVMAAHIEIAVGCGLRIADYDSILSDGLKEELGGPEVLCLTGCLQLVHEKVRPTGPTDRGISFVIDKDDRKREQNALYAFGQLQDVYGDRRFSGIEFHGRRDEIPLQAADFLAHQAFQHLRDELPAQGKIRNIVRQVLEGVRTHHLMDYSAENLREFEARWQAGPPSSSGSDS